MGFSRAVQALASNQPPQPSLLLAGPGKPHPVLLLSYYFSGSSLKNNSVIGSHFLRWPGSVKTDPSSALKAHSV